MQSVTSWLKQRRVWGSIVALAIIAVISIVYFYPDAIQGNVLSQHDMQQGMAIGQEAKAYAEATGETSRWTNSLFGGMPTFQIAPSYPSNSLFTWINTVMGLGLPSPADILAMMMVGFFILLMAMGMSLPVALIGAVAYGFSTYFIIIIGAGHLWKFITLAYIPPTIAGLVLCYRGRVLAGAAMTALFGMMQISSNHVQMTYYFLFVVLGLMAAWLVMAVRDGKVRQWAIATAALAAAGLLAVGANLPSLYNTYEYSKETMRGGHSDLKTDAGDNNTSDGGLDRDYITQYSYTPSETFTLLIPNVKGGATMKPEKGSARYVSLYDMESSRKLVEDGKLDPQAACYLQYVSQYFGAPEGTNGPVYVGALIFALFLLGCFIVKGPVKWALLSLTLFSIVLSWGRYCMWATDLMIDYMPMYSKFRTVESILVIAEFTMPLLAMMALQKLFSEEGPVWKRYRRPMLISFGITLLLCLAGIMVPSIYGSAIPDHERQSQLAQLFEYAPMRNAIETLRYNLVEADSLRSFVIAAIGFGVLMLFGMRRINSKVALLLIGITVAGDLYNVNKRYLDHESFMRRPLVEAESFPLSEADRMILADTAMNYRVMDIERFWQAAPSYHHKAVGGYHAAKLTRYQDLIMRHLGNFTMPQGPDSADMAVLNMLNARYIIQGGTAYENPDANGNAWFVDAIEYAPDADSEMAALSNLDLKNAAVADNRFRTILGQTSPKAAGDTIFETSYAPNRLTYHARSARGGIAVFSEVFFPWGWHATIDGKPAEIGRANYLLRAMAIPAGSHTVEMWFDPQSLHTTGVVATVSIVIIYVMAAGAVALFFVRRRRKENSASK